MAKFDTNSIEGYADMTPEEKVAALESFEYDDNANSLAQMKASFDRASKEAADWKKKHNQLLSEDERKQQEREDAMKTLQEELSALKREKASSQHKANALGLGMDDALATATAKALVDGAESGDYGSLFKTLQKFLTAHDHAKEVEFLQKTPRPADGEGGEAMTAEEIMKISDPVERQTKIRENIELFQ